MRTSIIAFSLLFAACADEPDVVLEDVGQLSVHNGTDLERADYPSTAPLAAGRMIVTVRHARSNCDGFEGSCSVRSVGGGLVVESRLSWDADPPDTYCTREAKDAVAHCLSPVLAEGSYSLSFGDAQAELVIPGDSGTMLDTSVALDF